MNKLEKKLIRQASKAEEELTYKILEWFLNKKPSQDDLDKCKSYSIGSLKNKYDMYYDGQMIGTVHRVYTYNGRWHSLEFKFEPYIDSPGGTVDGTQELGSIN